MLSCDLTNSFYIYCCGSNTVKRSSVLLSLTETRRRFRLRRLVGKCTS
jgi:hypothetical protein